MIITLAGAIGSGKSTLAKALAVVLSAPVAGFGDYVRALAAERGLDTGDRKVLQDLGHELVTTNARDFLERTLRWSAHVPGQTLVLDGLRHIAVLDALRAQAAEGPDSLLVVYVETSTAVRRSRAAAIGVSADEFDCNDSHPAEYDLREYLRTAADLVVPGDRPSLEVAEAVAAEVVRREVTQAAKHGAKAR
jgi:dephospho-CoA kinase